MTTSSALHETIGFDDFLKVELRVGRIVDAQVFKEARRPAYVLQVDFGSELGLRKSSAQITALYRPEELIGRQVVAVLNFPSKQIGPMRSGMPGHGIPQRERRGRAVRARPRGAAGHQAAVTAWVTIRCARRPP